MGLIELIRGLATSDDTLAKVEAFGRGLGKEIVHANDAPGFIVNRVLMPMINEAVFALGEGVATMKDIDAGCRLGLNHPMGPITLADRSEEHTSELQSLMRISYAVFCLTKKNTTQYLYQSTKTNKQSYLHPH